MNTNIRNTFRVGVIAFAGLLAFTSCSDTWDDHYDTTAGLDYDGPTMGYIKSQENLSNFAEILKATGYDNELNASQVLTVLAPDNSAFDDAAKQQLLDQIANGGKQQVIDRFVKNHILRYNVSLGAADQRLTLLNDKKIIVHTSAAATIGNTPVIAMNKACKNGIVQVLGGELPYTNNVYEQIEADYQQSALGQLMAKNSRASESEAGSAEGDNSGASENEGEGGEELQPEVPEIPSLFKFLEAYNSDSLDEARSTTSGEKTDAGDPIYVDSVMIRNNTALRMLSAYLFREDSTYWAIIPSAEAYAKRYEEVKKLLNYNAYLNTEEAFRDSVTNLRAHLQTCSDLFFNGNINQHPEDSIYSTSYSRGEWHYHVYYKNADVRAERDSMFGNLAALPERAEIGNILDGATEKECSNGKVYETSEMPYTIYDNFFKKIKVEGEASHLIDMDVAYTPAEVQTFSFGTDLGDSVSNGAYMRIVPSTKSKNTEFAYNIPNTLSGKYDIYVKFLPRSIVDSLAAPMPLQFRAGIFEQQANGQFQTRVTEFKNPVDGKKNYQTDPIHTDTVFVGTYDFKYSFYGLGQSRPGVKLKLQSYVPASALATYTREMVIDCILFVPHREEVAEAKKSYTK